MTRLDERTPEPIRAAIYRKPTITHLEARLAVAIRRRNQRLADVLRACIADAKADLAGTEGVR